MNERASGSEPLVFATGARLGALEAIVVARFKGARFDLEGGCLARVVVSEWTR